MDSNKREVLSTLAYYDIFEYPLKIAEIEKYLPKKISSIQLQKSLKSKAIGHQRDYFFLKGREYIVDQRKKREEISMKKLQKAQKLVKFLSKIPTIQYVGISGSLAMYNAKKNDDIDLFIITSTNRLWTSRLLVNGILVLLGKLRRFGSKTNQDSFCTNMWIDMDHLSFSQARKNIYTAHEIVQLITLCNKNYTYQQFLIANDWIKHLLPSINISVSNISNRKAKKGNVIELVAKNLQLWYMKKHQTTEIVTEGFVAFHPDDYTKKILYEWQKRIKKYDI